MTTHKTTFGLASGLSILASVLLVWLSLGVGIIGQDGDPANRMYFAVIAIGVAGSLLSRFQSVGLARTLLAMALAQTLIALFAVFTGLGQPWSGPLELSLLNGFFVVMFAVAAWLFQRSAGVTASATA